MKINYVSTSEAGEILGISRVQIFRLIKSGKIPAERIGRNYLIKKEILNHIERERSGKSEEITPEDKKNIDNAVKKVLAEYGDVIKKLGEE